MSCCDGGCGPTYGEPIVPIQATITPTSGWWFKYTVDRSGLGHSEKPTTKHRSLRSAKKAKRAWDRNIPPQQVEWCVLFHDGHRLVLTEKHARQVTDFHTTTNRTVKLQSRIVHPWTDVTN
jgi:hypothetical protein